MLLGATACSRVDRSNALPGAASPALTPPPPATALAIAPAARERLVLLAGGDVSFGRVVGQELLRAPARDLFAGLGAWIAGADLRFANLEGPLSDQKGETQRVGRPLVFTGPPGGADALSRAGFSVVSTANNHAWDYGRAALFETMTNLERVGITYAGTGRDRQQAYQPAVVAVGGFRVGFLAVTDIWNQGPLGEHEGASFVAEADGAVLAKAVRRLQGSGEVDAVVVSYHGGSEYLDEPVQRTQAILRGAIDAGADVVLGHHPHVVQGVEWRAGKPIFYSLGNLLMRMNKDQAWTEFGLVARVTLSREGRAEVAACPTRIDGITPVPLYRSVNRQWYERRFFGHLGAVSRRVGGVVIGAAGADGCAELTAP